MSFHCAIANCDQATEAIESGWSIVAGGGFQQALCPRHNTPELMLRIGRGETLTEVDVETAPRTDVAAKVLPSDGMMRARVDQLIAELGGEDLAFVVAVASAVAKQRGLAGPHQPLDEVGAASRAVAHFRTATGRPRE